MTDRLDHCPIHGDTPCDCPAYLVTLGLMDLALERRLEQDPAFAEELAGRLRGDNRQRSNGEGNRS